MAEQKQIEALINLRIAIDDLFRTTPLLRRFLDFSRPLPPRAFTRLLPRTTRELIAERLRKPRFPALSIAPQSWNKALAEKIAPHRGHQFTFRADFVAQVDAWRGALLSGRTDSLSARRRVHLISPRAKRAVSIKRAIEMYLLNELRRQPTSKEIKNAQAVYSQRALRS